MIVCVCSNVSHTTIEKAVSQGCHSVVELQMTTGACTGCGQCRGQCEQFLAQAKTPARSIQRHLPSPSVTPLFSTVHPAA